MGTTAKQQDNANAATKPNGMTMNKATGGDWETERQGEEGETMKGRWGEWKKAQETSNNVSWAIGKFFFPLISLFYY